MIHFPILKTKRFNLQLKEISIGNAIQCSTKPIQFYESTLTHFLKNTISICEGIDNPLLWTVQERNYVIAHYLASVFENGPNFDVGQGKLFDYLNPELDITSPTPIEIGEVGGDKWLLNDLLGTHAESIERTIGEIDNLKGFYHYFFGAMAAQLTRVNEDIPDPLSLDYDQFLVNRIKILQEYPESDFMQLSTLYLINKEKLQQYFYYSFDDDGIIILPRPEVGHLPAARFLLYSHRHQFA